MKTRSQGALVQMSLVLIIAIAAAVGIGIWKVDFLRDVYFADLKTILLNGIILLLFGLGVGHLYRSFIHFVSEETRVAEFIQKKSEGLHSEVIMPDPNDRSIIADRYYTIKNLFDRAVPINHSAISAIMVAEESLHQSFPKFVNNVLILTGVFGTVSSLIFALIGASDVMQSALPGEGIGVMLLGMNTALTTTATAIVCYFFFTYFYQQLTDAQTNLFSQIEWAVLVHIIPDFAFDSDSLNHQTESLVHEVRQLVEKMRDGVVGMERSLAVMNEGNHELVEKWDAFLASREQQSGKMEELRTQLSDMYQALIDGFRLK